MQEKIVLISNLLSNRLDNLVNSFNKKVIINYCQNKNVTSFWLLVTRRNDVVYYCKLEKQIEFVKKTYLMSVFSIKK